MVENKERKEEIKQGSNSMNVKKGDLIDTKKYFYILKDGIYFYSLMEINENNYIFNCFTEPDYAIGPDDNSFPRDAGFYGSAEEAISDLVDFFEIYKFNNRCEYFLWLVSELQKTANNYLVEDNKRSFNE